MKNRFVLCNFRIPMNLQIFAEGDGAGADDGNGGGSEGDAGDGAGAEGAGSEGTQLPAFDDYLKSESNQAEFDRRVQKAVNTAVTKAQDKWQALTNDKLSEAEKLAKMTKEEKEQYNLKKREQELADREANITRQELMATAKNTLADKSIPAGLAEVLSYSDADSCNKSIETVEKAFREAVEAAVQDKLKGDAPPKKAPADASLSEQVANALKGNH